MRSLAGPLAWAASGGMHLTGWPDGPPLAPRGDVLAGARAAAARVPGADAALELFGRAALAGHQRAGRTSTGGACRLLRAADGWVAVSLARADDLAAVAAIVECADSCDDPWGALADHAASRASSAVVARVQLLDVPASVLGEPTCDPITVTTLGEPAAAPPPRPVVVDLSALWAGPLCARLLGMNGAEVVAVESATRPDPSRDSMPQFHAHLRARHERACIDFTSGAGRDQLLALLRRADVVIEAARPRALRRLDIDAEALVAERPGLTWLSITAHGRTGSDADRVGFGDDAAVAGGLVAWDERDEPVFCGDAIADPLTGLYAAGAALSSLAAGGGHLVAVAMRDVVAHAMAAGGPMTPHDTVAVDGGAWVVRANGCEAPVLAPARP